MGGDGELVWQSNAAFFLACAARSPGGRVVELGGVAAGITPLAPERPVLNSVICPPGTLDARGYEEIATLYAAPGCPASPPGCSQRTSRPPGCWPIAGTCSTPSRGR